MHLWTEYEGRTIAGSYTLGKLLRSEGRNGFFATSDSTGNSAVIRLTEAHFDEEEVLKRWRQVAELHQDHLIEIERVGKTDFDGVALTYALMERNDANLEDVLKERPLTTAETTEVAKSVLAALTTLHASGLVHEHIEPVNILAVGEVVKLRSDCVRECVADGEFTSEEACEDLRKRDIHDFGALLLQCLTLEREVSPGLRLSEPFRRIVPAAMDGHMSLRQIDALLNPVSAPASGSAPIAGNTPVTPPLSPATKVRPPLVPEGVRVAAAAAIAQAGSREVSETGRAHPEPTMPMRAAKDTFRDAAPTHFSFKPMWLVGVAVALLLLSSLFYAFRSKPAASAPQRASTAATATPGATDAPAVVVAGPAHNNQRTQPAAGQDEPVAAAPTAAAPPTAHGPGWYVIAYTYNRENQARVKVERLERKRGGFHPVVFSPFARGPYLVALGGPMNEAEAEALMRRARHSGLPRDTFVRRY